MSNSNCSLAPMGMKAPTIGDNKRVIPSIQCNMNELHDQIQRATNVTHTLESKTFDREPRPIPPSSEDNIQEALDWAVQAVSIIAFNLENINQRL